MSKLYRFSAALLVALICLGAQAQSTGDNTAQSSEPQGQLPLDALRNFADVFNQDISGWDTSNVMDMSDMFYFAGAFNQDLSVWCVADIDEKPSEFDTSTNAWEGGDAVRPQWGAPCD